MKREDIDEIVKRLLARPQFQHYERLDPVGLRDTWRQELEGLDVSPRECWAIVRFMLHEDGRNFPLVEDVVKQVLRDRGVLAPTWAEAQAEVNAALARISRGEEIGRMSHAVRAATDAMDWHRFTHPDGDEAASWAQLRRTYEETAREFDRIVLGPGGLDRLREMDEQAARPSRRQLALNFNAAQYALQDAHARAGGGPNEVPFYSCVDLTDAQLEAFVSNAARKLGVTVDEMLNPPKVEMSAEDIARNRERLDDMFGTLAASKRIGKARPDGDSEA